MHKGQRLAALGTLTAAKAAGSAPGAAAAASAAMAAATAAAGLKRPVPFRESKLTRLFADALGGAAVDR